MAARRYLPTYQESQRYYDLIIGIINREDDYWNGLETWADMIARYNIVPPNDHWMFRFKAACQWVRECLAKKITISVADFHKLTTSKLYRIWRIYENTGKPEDLVPGQYYHISANALEDRIAELEGTYLSKLEKQIEEARKKLQALLDKRRRLLNV